MAVAEDDDLVEVVWTEGARQINECQYVFAISVREAEELTLEILLEEAKPQAEILVVKSDDPVDQVRLGGRPIETDQTCRKFRLIFESRHMVSYTVLNESYGTYPQPPEEFSGKLFRAFSWSHLLEFTKRTTFASDEYPGVLQHYEIACLNHVIEIACLNHVIDVICTAPPLIFAHAPLANVQATLQ